VTALFGNLEMTSKYLNLRLRSADKGIQHLRNVDCNTSFAEFKALVQKTAEIPIHQQKCKFHGYLSFLLNFVTHLL
jgi:hypothetical protein